MGSKGMCPVCQKPTSETYRPFCCKRCADVDLGRWFNESYTVESEEGLVEEEASGIANQEQDT